MQDMIVIFGGGFRHLYLLSAIEVIVGGFLKCEGIPKSSETRPNWSLETHGLIYESPCGTISGLKSIKVH